MKLTQEEMNLYGAMMRSEMENGRIIVPPGLAKKANEVLDKIKRGAICRRVLKD